MQYGICRYEVLGFIGWFTGRSMCQRSIEIFQKLKNTVLFNSVIILASCVICLTPILEHDAVAQVTLHLDLGKTTKGSRPSDCLL